LIAQELGLESPWSDERPEGGGGGGSSSSSRGRMRPSIVACIAKLTATRDALLTESIPALLAYAAKRGQVPAAAATQAAAERLAGGWPSSFLGLAPAAGPLLLEVWRAALPDGPAYPASDLLGVAATKDEDIAQLLKAHADLAAPLTKLLTTHGLGAPAASQALAEVAARTAQRLLLQGGWVTDPVTQGGWCALAGAFQLRMIVGRAGWEGEGGDHVAQIAEIA